MQFLPIILILIFTVLLVPYLGFHLLPTGPTMEQWAIIKQLMYLVGVVIAYCFISGELTNNNSQVDKLWSILPIFYAWYCAIMGGFGARLVLMAFLVTIWGVRLTLNFMRRGGYTFPKIWEGDEDYRWGILRRKPGFSNRLIWAIFDLFFISGYQNILIFLFTLPVLACYDKSSKNGIDFIDMFLSVLFCTVIVIEYLADEQQSKFQTEKYRRINAKISLAGTEYEKGFIDSGLWGLCRHPNYAMEQSVWIVFYLFTVNALGLSSLINWSIGGALLLVVLFRVSSDFSEEISASKYPQYKDYQRRVARFIPFLY